MFIWHFQSSEGYCNIPVGSEPTAWDHAMVARESCPSECIWIVPGTIDPSA